MLTVICICTLFIGSCFPQNNNKSQRYAVAYGNYRPATFMQTISGCVRSCGVSSAWREAARIRRRWQKVIRHSSAHDRGGRSQPPTRVPVRATLCQDLPVDSIMIQVVGTPERPRTTSAAVRRSTLTNAALDLGHVTCHRPR